MFSDSLSVFESNAEPVSIVSPYTSPEVITISGDNTTAFHGLPYTYSVKTDTNDHADVLRDIRAQVSCFCAHYR